MKNRGPLITLWILWTLFIMSGSVDAKMNPRCDTEKEYKHNQLCCKKCPPGTHMSARCTDISETICSNCSSNGYMSVWNDDMICNLHMLCDPGKALQALHNGNSTYARECVCIEGYHFDTKQEICMENTNCAPGFGLLPPVQRNRNTECVPCEEGYFSNSSSVELCHPWTNCTELGLETKLGGTNKTDAVCDQFDNKLSQVVIPTIVLIMLTLTAVFIILVMCCRKKYSPLKVAVQDWVEETCDKLCGSEKKSPYTESDMLEPNCDYIKIATSPEEISCPYSNNMKEMEVPRGRLIPTEDEYMDQRRLSEPGNGVIESLSDLESASLGTLPADSDAGSDRFLFFKEDLGTPPCLEHQHPSFRKWQEERYTTDSIQNSSRPEFHINPQADYSIPEKNADDDLYSCFTNTQYTRSSSRDSTDSVLTSEIPSSPSGNVTGNNNTTVISSAPVMNIKTDMVVVYCSGHFQDAHTPSENEENIKRPMQEERQDHCDSFVTNAQPYRYTIEPCCSKSNIDCTEAVHIPGDSRCPTMSSQDLSETIYCNNTDFLPVQEEGKPEFYHSEFL